jgi:hypothetical protein
MSAPVKVLDPTKRSLQLQEVEAALHTDKLELLRAL